MVLTLVKFNECGCSKNEFVLKNVLKKWLTQVYFLVKYRGILYEC